MSAADVIKFWSDQLVADGGYMLGVATATQAGNPAFQSAAIVGYAEFSVSRNVDGDLNGPEAVMLFSDRQEKEADDSINQPFNVGQADSSGVLLKLNGDLVLTSYTWGGTETIPLTDLGNGVLGGWGVNSIGNKGTLPYWTVTLDQQVHAGLCLGPTVVELGKPS